MRRLYFLLPDLDTTKTVVDELLLARIEDRHIHIVAKEGTPLEDLPEASFQSDVGPAIERGVVLGGVTGVLAGLVAITFPPAGLVLGGGAVLALGVLGAGMGGFYSAMIGLDVEDRRITNTGANHADTSKTTHEALLAILSTLGALAPGVRTVWPSTSSLVDATTFPGGRKRSPSGLHRDA